MTDMKATTLQFLYSYKPMRVTDVTKRDWDVRRLVWAFKEGRYSEFCAKVVAKRLIDTYGEKVSRYVFACIPASSESRNEARYKRFACMVCQLTGCMNAYDAIKVSGQRLAIHEYKNAKRVANTQVIDFDKRFFLGREVIVFDDIFTRGKSYERFASTINRLGASVVGGIFLGKTYSYSC